MDEVLNGLNLKKLEDLNNPHVMEIVEKYIKLCKPATVTVVTDSEEDIVSIRKKAIELNSNHYAMHLELDKLYKIEDRIKEAINEIRFSLSVAPDNPLAFIELATILIELGHRNEAYEFIDNA